MNFISLNVAGSNNPLKRCRIAKAIIEKQADRVCIQETHDAQKNDT